MALAIMISLNFATAQTVLQTASASINPSEIYADAETEILTVITWSDAI